MSFLKGYVYTLCVVLIIISVIDAALPSAEIKKTLKSVLGIIVAVVLISPFFNLSIEEGIMDFETEDLVDYEKAQEMEKFTMGMAETELAKRMEEALLEIGMETAKVRVKLSDDGIIEKVEVEDAGENHKKYISEKFSVELEKIFII